ncbi:MAG TPA: O-antigen ligase family protein, partial [Conexibacter sp.]|nr:O-antigen ligase family protein [Conexibacter sp.]
MSQRLRSEGIVLVPALSAIALLVYWAAHGGGYATTTWEPSALVVLGLLAATVAGVGLTRVALSRASAIALAALAAYTLWSYLSIAWAAAPGDALDGANRTLLYLLLFGLFALLPWKTWTALAALGTFALAIGVLAIVTLLRLRTHDVASMFIDGRLVAPLDYVNATAALFLAAAFVSAALAAQRELPPLLRALLLGLATAALQVSVLPASRGWLFSLPVVLALAVLLVPGRLRFLLWLTLPAAGTLVALPALLDVYQHYDAALTPASALSALADGARHAAGVSLVATAVVLALAVGLAFADRATTVPTAVTRQANRVAVGLAILAALVGVGAGLAATHGRPDRTIGDYWDRSNGYQSTDPGASRFALAGSNRPDFWRVSLDATADHPIGGLGQDNWGDYYLVHRHADEQPRWTHSLELRLLAHTGIVGFLLFAVFVAGAVAAVLRGRRRASRLTNVAAAAACLPAVVWVVHGSIDWFWEIPALSGPTFAFLGLAGALMRADADPDPARDAVSAPTRDRVGELLLGGGLVLLALVAAAALALPWLAEREVAAASSGWQADPAKAFARLNRAADLNPLSARPALVGGVIALELGNARLAQQRFAAALDRNDDWFARFGQ